MSSFDVKKFAEFYAIMDWEGGLEAVIRHGHDSTGDATLDSLMSRLETALDRADAHISELFNSNKEAVEAEMENMYG